LVIPLFAHGLPCLLLPPLLKYYRVAIRILRGKVLEPVRSDLGRLGLQAALGKPLIRGVNVGATDVKARIAMSYDA
jgi:hypothetical protein